MIGRGLVFNAARKGLALVAAFQPLIKAASDARTQLKASGEVYVVLAGSGRTQSARVILLDVGKASRRSRERSLIAGARNH